MDIRLPDDGMITVELGDTIKSGVDLFHVNAMLRDHQEKSKDMGEVEWCRGIVEIIQSLGFPTCSFKAAVDFRARIIEAVEAAKKKP